MEFLEGHKHWDVEEVKNDVTKRLGPLLEHIGKLKPPNLELSEVDVTFDIEGNILVVKADGSVSLKFTKPTKN